MDRNGYFWGDSMLRRLTVLLPLMLGACATVPEPVALEGAPVGANIQVRFTSSDRNGICRDDRLAGVAEAVARSAFRGVSGNYQVTISPVPGSRIACFSHSFGENLLLDLTLIGFFLPDVFHPYTAYNVAVDAGKVRVLEKNVHQIERSTKSQLNLGKYKDLAKEAETVFQVSLANALQEVNTRSGGG